MTRSSSTFSFAAFAALSFLLAGPALAQQERSSGNFLDNLFSRGEPQGQSRAAPQPQPQGRVAQTDPGDLTVRLDRLEGALRQLTGTIEQLQYRNQQLETQLKRMQDDTEYRFQQMGGRGGSAPPPSQGAPQGARHGPGVAPGSPPAYHNARSPFRRIFDPSQNPDCAGRAAHVGKPGGNRGARTEAGQRPAGRCPRWPRRRRAARSIDPCRKRSRIFASRRTAANGAAAGDCRIRGADAAAGVAKRSAIAAAASTQCCAGWPAARDTSAFGHAAGRVRHGLRLRPA